MANEKGPILTALEEVRKNPTLASEALAKRSAQNTRPSAPVEGLVRYDISMFGNGAVEMGGGEYVLYDQAAAIIAAKDAEIERYREQYREAVRNAFKDSNAALSGEEPS